MNEIIYNRLDDSTIEVVKPVEVTPETKTYDIGFLKQQELDITKSKNDFIETRDKELAEVRELLSQCEILDIKPKVEELERLTIETTDGVGIGGQSPTQKLEVVTIV